MPPHNNYDVLFRMRSPYHPEVSNSDLIALAVRRESGLDMILREAARLRDETSSLSAMCTAKAAEVAQLGERLAADHAANSELKLLIQAAQEDLASVNSRVDEAKQSAGRVSEETVQEEKRMADERVEFRKAQAQIEAESEGLRVKLASVVRELGSKKSVLERNSEVEILQARAQNDELRGRIRALQQSLANLEKESAETEAHMKRFSAMVDSSAGSSVSTASAADAGAGAADEPASGVSGAPTPSEPLPRDPREWSTVHVLQWLSGELGLPAAVTDAVAATCLDGPALASVTDGQLAEVFGVAHALHRRKILKNLQRLMPDSTATAGGSGAQAVMQRRILTPRRS